MSESMCVRNSGQRFAKHSATISLRDGVQSVSGVVLATLCSLVLMAAGSSVASQPAEARSITYQLSIPAQSLDEALKVLSTSTNEQLLFSKELVQGKQSAAVQGQYTTNEALEILLSGSGLKADRTPSGVLLIRSAAAKEVSGKARKVSGSDAAPDAPRIGGEKSSWVGNDRSAFRLAQSERATTAPPAEPQKENASGKLEEIVVTAQKREERLQDVPVSVHVVTGEVLADRNYNSLSELTQAVPGVHVSTGGQANSIYVRGIGSNDNPAFEQSVATFVDDIYRGRSRMSNAAFLDLERVEFLKGPQSTFFGNNAIAGALNLVTRKPGNVLESSARVLYGSHGKYAVEGAVGGPVSDAFGLRVAATANGIDRGWGENLVTGERLPIKHTQAGRAILTYRSGADLDVTLKGEAGKSKTTGTAYDSPRQYVYCPPPAPLAVNSVYRECSRALSEGVPIGLDGDQVAGVAGQGNRLSTYEGVLTINYEKWGHLFTSISGYSDYDSQLDFDAANVRSWQNTTRQAESFSQTSQELRLTSPSGARFEYMAGLYYQKGDLDSSLQTNGPFLTPALSANPALQPFLPWAFKASFTQGEELRSVFGSLRWNVTDRLKANAGLRGSWVRKDFDGHLHYGTATSTFGGFVQFPASVESLAALLGAPGQTRSAEKNDAWMPSTGLQYQLTPQMMTYATYTKGFKAGGFNAIDPTNNAQNPGNGAYNPEYVTAYEVGLKSKWFDDRVLVNVDVFVSDYKDLQVTSLIYRPATDTYTSTVRNAAKSRSQGVELETELALGPSFSLGANIAFLDAHYVSYTDAAPTAFQRQAGLRVQDLSGRPTDFSPDWSGSITARYRTLVSERYEVIGEISPYFSSSFYTSDGTDDPLSEISGFVRIDARLSVLHTERSWGVDLIGKNLADRVIPIRLVTGFGHKQEPRNVSLQFRYGF